MKSTFRVFDTNVLFEAPFELKSSGFSDIFKCDFDDYDFKCEVVTCEKLPVFNGVEVYSTKTQRVIENHYATCRFIIDPLLHEEIAMSVYSFFDRTVAQVYLINSEADKLNDIYYLWTIVRPDVICRNSGILMVHASYIVDADNRAILFTAESGVGKSTQAKLWHDNAGAVIVNGDKAIIRYENGKINAYGYPVSGTSAICLNETHEIKAIVSLSQAKENILTELNNNDAFKKIIKNVFIDVWNADDVLTSSVILKRVIKHCRTYSYECLPDKSAFDILNNEINNGEEQYDNGTS